MEEPDLRSEMFELLGALTNREIAPEQYDRLEKLLGESKQAREMYLDYLDLDFELGELHTDAAVPQALQVLAHLSESSTSSSHVAAGRGRRWLTYAAVAFLTLSASLLMQVFLLPGDSGKHPVARNEESSADAQEIPYIATVASVVDGVWGDGHVTLPEGWRLAPGTVDLRLGTAKIRFDGGIELVVEGPCVLDIQSGQAATLVHGKVVLHGDDISERFALHTPSATFVDLGTEYAIEVDTQGATEVHVFDGLVEREPKGGERVASVERIAAGQAKRYTTGPNAEGRDIPLAPARFVRNMPSRPNRDIDLSSQLVAYEQFNYSATQLPSTGSGAGGIGWDGPWRSYDSRGPVALNPAENLEAAAASGGSIDQTGGGQIRRTLETPIRLDVNGVYYVSYIFQSLGEEGGDKLRLSLCSSQALRDFEGWKRLHFGKYKSDLVFGYLAGRRYTIRLPLERNAMYRLVAKIVASRDGPDQTLTTLYRVEEPIDREEPSSWSLVSPVVSSDLVLDEVWISMNGETRQRFDELRIGSTWTSVTQPIPLNRNE